MNGENLTIVESTALDRIWKKDHFRVFLSHKSEVKKETAELKDTLEIYGVTAFVAHENIQPTQQWLKEIENALKTSDAFVALLTEKFHDSEWTDQEVGFALCGGIKTIPVKIDKINPRGFLGKFQAINCAWSNAPLEIIKILIKEELMLDAYIRKINDCPDYDAGNKLSCVLPFIENMTDKQVNDILTAYNSNSQIHDCFGFNGTKPHSHGKGLPALLERITNKKYILAQDNKIII